MLFSVFFFFSSRRRHTRSLCDWSSDVCSSDLELIHELAVARENEYTVEEVELAIHAHPTMSEAVAQAALDSLGRVVGQGPVRVSRQLGLGHMSFMLPRDPRPARTAARGVVRWAVLRTSADSYA